MVNKSPHPISTAEIFWQCARAAHEMNRLYCEANDDLTQPVWESAPDWQRKSAIEGVKGVVKGNTPEQSHTSWLKVKLDDGWKFGETKNADKKEHPCMVPYAELPPAQQAKDKLFVRTVQSMFEALLRSRITITDPAETEERSVTICLALPDRPEVKYSCAAGHEEQARAHVIMAFITAEAMRITSEEEVKEKVEKK